MNQLLVNLVCAALAVASSSVFKIVLSNRLTWKGSTNIFVNEILFIMRMYEFWLGLTLFILSQILWLYILATQKFSIAYPLQVALSIILFSTVAHCFFKETINFKQIIALCLIFLGITLLKT